MAIQKLKAEISRTSNLPMCKFDGKKKFAGAARAAYDAKSKHYFNKLRTVLANCESRECRRSIFKKYRTDLESRQLALFRQLTDQTKAKVAADIAACKARKFSPEKEAVCIKTIQKWEKNRLDTLRVRHLNLDKRRELRMCAVTSNPSSCRAAVRKEFADDVKRIHQHLEEEEGKSVVADETAKRSASASKVSFTIATVFAVVVAAVALLKTPK
jgi:hypothetical protein